MSASTNLSTNERRLSIISDSSADTSIFDDDDDDDTLDLSQHADTKVYKKTVRKVRRGNRKAKLIGAVVTVIDFNHPGSLAAYEAIRPLVVRLTCLSTRSAYISFRFYAQLQRVVKDPYPPNITEYGKWIPHNAHNSRTKILNRNLKKFVRIAAAVYPYDTLHEQGVVFVSEQTRNTDQQLVARMKKVLNLKIKILKHKENPKSYAPAWALIEDHHDKQLILVIQGSNTFADWVTNLMCTPDDKQGTHAGMTQAATAITDEVKNLVVEFLRTHPTYSFIATGHSLGAGVASLLTMEWIDNLVPPEYRNRMHCYAFAPPCTIPDTLAGRYADHITSVIFGKDLVPRLSFGSSRDLLIVMQALTNLEKKGRAGKDGATAAEIIESGNSKVNDEGLDEQAEAEWKLLPSRRSTAGLEAYQTDLTISTDVSFHGLSQRKREEQIERMALTMVAKPLDFGGASFHQIASILKRREAELDRLRETLKVKTIDDAKASWFSRFMWKVVKLFVGRCRSTYEHLDATIVQEDEILK